MARDILAARGVAPDSDAMSAVMPMCYVVADGAVKALAQMGRELSVELAGGQAVIRIPVSAGLQVDIEVDPADLAAWECEFSGDDLGPEGGL